MDDNERPSIVPLVAYLVVGILAIIGAISIAGWLMGAVWFGVKVALVLAVIFLVLKGLGSMRSDRKRSSSESVSPL